MRDYSVQNSFGSALERMSEGNSPFGDVSNYNGPSGRAVYSPYTNFQKGTLSMGYDGRESFSENYNMRSSTPVNRIW